MFFEHFTVSQDGAKPFLRIRLESSWEDDGTVEGSIDTQFYYISSDEDTIRDEDKHRAPRKDLDKIRVLLCTCFQERPRRSWVMLQVVC